MKPKTLSNKVIIEYDHGDFYIMYPSGVIEIATSSKEALRYVKAKMAKLGRRRKAIIVTKIEWRNLPPGVTL